MTLWRTGTVLWWGERPREPLSTQRRLVGSLAHLNPETKARVGVS